MKSVSKFIPYLVGKCLILYRKYIIATWILLVLSAGVAEYTDCISAEGQVSPNDCPNYGTKQSDGEVPVMLKFWEIRSTPSLPSPLGPLWPRVVAPDRVLSMGQIKLNCVLTLNWIFWNRTVFTFNYVQTKNYTYAKLNSLNQNYLYVWKWIWN